ncbi:hypothetical protein BASA81_001699 [Batrachochytrium salamandrivorans]|nr:hypothetical protein BASA81_001699 [Batrachochytrium salamandrivorans]
MELVVQSHPSPSLAHRNMAFLNPADFALLVASLPLSQQTLKLQNIVVQNKVLPCSPLDSVKQGVLSLGLLHRSYAQTVLDQLVQVKLYLPTEHKVISELSLKVSLISKKPNQPVVTVESEELQVELLPMLSKVYFAVGLKLSHVFKQQTLLQLEVSGVKIGESNLQFEQAALFQETVSQVKFIKTEGVAIRGQTTDRSVNRMLEVNFEQLGIGGLDKEMWQTLIARQISQALQSNTPEDKRRKVKVVNGPEILSKFVGETEKNLRDLFADAEAEQEENGNESELHVIIFDEIDAIAKKRGSSRDGTGVHDSLVNQLLSKIDGVNALNNILLIGMTNRLDMLDPALLRPGRFEVQVEISLPDTQGRVQILNIHTAKMKKAGYLSSDVSIDDLAEKTKNFTGAEIEGLVKGAAAWAFQRQVNTQNFKVVDASNLLVLPSDFEEALLECKPQFGAKEAEDEMRQHMGNQVVMFSDEGKRIASMLSELAREAASDRNMGMNLVSVLLCGQPGSGKTALAAKVAYESGFPLVRVLSPDKFIGMSESTKCSAIADVFDEAYKSEKSLILLEDLERLVDYSKVGPRFSNQVLQTLLILIRKPPPKKGRKLFVIGTSSVRDTMDNLEISSVFNMVLNAPQVANSNEVLTVLRAIAPTNPEAVLSRIAQVCPTPISVKRLMLALEMAMRNGDGIEESKFIEFLQVS